MPRRPPCRRRRSPLPTSQGKPRTRKKQGNFRVFCNSVVPASHCRQASTTRRRQLRRRAPACPLAEKKFRDCVRFRHRTSANAQKCANFFASCGGHDARDASRAASPRRVASRHRDTTCMHVADTPRHTRLPSPTPGHASIDAFAWTRRPAQPAEVVGRRRHAPRRRASATYEAAPRRRCLFVADPHRASAPRRKTGTDRYAGRANRLRPHAANTLRSRGCPRKRSHAVFAKAQAAAGEVACRDNHGETGDADADDDGRVARPQKRNRPHWAAGSGVATGSRLSGRRPRAVRHTRPATAVRSTARHRPLPAPGSSLRRRRPR